MTTERLRGRLGGEKVARLRCERGAAMIEFALVLPLLLTLVLGLVDFGRAINYWINETHLATSGARLAAVNKDPATIPGPCDSATTLQGCILAQTKHTAELNAGAQVCISFPNSTSNVGDPVQVRM